MNQDIGHKSGNQRKASLNDHLPEVESFLESTFQPIAPRPDFVRGLKTRLADPAYVQRSPNSNLYFLVLLGVAISATVLIVAGMVRLVVMLMGSLHMLNLFNRRANLENR